MHHSQKAARRFIVARGQSAELLEATEKAPHFIAVPVQVLVNHALDEAVLFAGNDGLGTDGGHTDEHGIGVVGFVGQHVVTEVKRLRAEGLSYRKISEATGVSLGTVQKYLVI